METRAALLARVESATELPGIVLSLAWLIILVVPYMVRLRASTAAELNLVAALIWALFVIDLLVKVAIAPRRRAFLRAHWFDALIVVVPFLRPFRALRLLRILKIDVLFKVAVVLARGLATLRKVFRQRHLGLVLVSVMVLCVTAAALEVGFETHAHGSTIHNFGEGIWWALVTITTVGYGDTAPVTAGGRGVAAVLMITGIGLVGVLSANLSSFLIGEDQRKFNEELIRRIGELESILRQVVRAENATSISVASPVPGVIDLRHQTDLTNGTTFKGSES